MVCPSLRRHVHAQIYSHDPDVLEQFSAPPKPTAKPAPAPASTSSSQTPLAKDAPPSAPKAVDPFGLGGLDADFAAELTRGMESLFKDIAGGAGLDGIPDLSEAEDGTTDEERAKAFKAAWEAMLVEGMDGAMSAEDVGSDKGKAAEGAVPGAGVPTDSFQENIRKAMERMKESDRKVCLLYRRLRSIRHVRC